ncbi:hypothetical protein SBRCBS47491_005935 [Sporothrix bragantina]|uniref:T6SS Phospholipase effector Tle1-like catalytic domain-containing protein n=1 Tax=Sporothrix bragantina TaxID=671064 RepID=A0ABP0C322_9PEZI
MTTSPIPAKTLIVCCDGTWVNAAGSDSRGKQPTNVSRLIRALRPTTEGSSPEPQIVNYHAGVGSSGQFLDASIGGTFGLGLDQDIRDMYQFLCLNYSGGDRIVLVGFSRGAFTARSVADLVASVGLLTPAGMDRFYDIFDDYENMADPERAAAGKFICPADVLEPYANQKAEAWIQWENRRKTQYRAWLKSEGYTKDTFLSDGKEQEILIKAVAVWDTVGCLGIPAVPVLGLQGSARQWKFTNTQISSKVENAFQALGLDEPRYDFLPSLWERLPGNTRTHLLQVWFAGSHKNTGGGQNDQQLANLSLAWMCDQLASVGIAFDEARLSDVFKDDLRYSAVHPFPYVPTGGIASGIVHAVGELGHQGVELVSSLFSSHKHSTEHKQHEAEANAAAAARKKGIPLPWGKAGVLGEAALSALQGPPSRLIRDAADCPGKYKHKHPDAPVANLWASGARPWGLGQSRVPTSLLQRAAGVTTRKPAMFVRVDPESNQALPNQPLLNTNEQIHASVRVRLACGGLTMDDTAVWTCEGLTGQKASDDDDGSSSDEDSEDRSPLWHLERVDGAVDLDGVQDKAVGGDKYYALGKVAGAGKWQWVFNEKKFAAATAKAAASKKKAKVDHDSNNQMPPQGPLLRVLPEALPTGRWERLLLAMTVGKPDVLAWASANPYRNA